MKKLLFVFLALVSVSCASSPTTTMEEEPDPLYELDKDCPHHQGRGGLRNCV